MAADAPDHRTSLHKDMRVAIIGSGFSGVAIAWQLLARLPAGSVITMINGSGRFARGLAYGTQSAGHLLNVPAARMSLDPARPDHFVDWLRRDDAAVEGHEFVPRQRYGDYLQSSLEQGAATRAGVALQQRVTTVMDCEPVSAGWRLRLADGDAPLVVDAVILAIGHLAPRHPHAALAGLPGYVADPWADGATGDLHPEAPVALLGSGLTMIDVLITLGARRHRGPILALSRRGLLPQGHRGNELPLKPWALDAGIAAARPLRRQLRLFRAELARAQAADVNWRDVWAAFRSQTPQAWTALDARSRGQFLRHLLPYWDVHRHRAAPQALAVLDEGLRSGRLQQAAGRVHAVQPLGTQLRLTWRARGSSQLTHFDAARVINCTGPSSAIDEVSSPLLWQLQQAGRLLPCAHGLGLQVDDGYRMLDAAGQGQHGLHYLGPHLRARFWEATAVPELREHAAALARAMTLTA